MTNIVASLNNAHSGPSVEAVDLIRTSGLYDDVHTYNERLVNQFVEDSIDALVVAVEPGWRGDDDAYMRQRQRSGDYVAVLKLLGAASALAIATATLAVIGERVWLMGVNLPWAVIAEFAVLALGAPVFLFVQRHRREKLANRAGDHVQAIRERMEKAIEQTLKTQLLEDIPRLRICCSHDISRVARTLLDILTRWRQIDRFPAAVRHAKALHDKDVAQARQDNLAATIGVVGLVGVLEAIIAWVGLPALSNAAVSVEGLDLSVIAHHACVLVFAAQGAALWLRAGNQKARDHIVERAIDDALRIDPRREDNWRDRISDADPASVVAEIVEGLVNDLGRAMAA